MISPLTNRVPFNNIISPFDDYYDKNQNIEYKKEFPHRPGNLIYSQNFVLILNDFVYSFQEISGIDIDFPNRHDIEEGGNPYHQFVRKTIMEEDTTNLTLKRAMPIRHSQKKYKRIAALAATALSLNIGFARKMALLAAAKQDPIYTLEHGPAEGFIQIFDRNFKNDIANFKFLSYGAHKWTLGELDATSGNIVYETIELICTNFKRVLPSSNSISTISKNLWINSINNPESEENKEFENLENTRIKKQSEQSEQEKRIQEFKNKLKNNNK